MTAENLLLLLLTPQSTVVHQQSLERATKLKVVPKALTTLAGNPQSSQVSELLNRRSERVNVFKWYNK